MAIPYVMPKLAMAMNEGTINEWLVQEGDFVAKAQPLASIETEKVAYDVESPEEGYIRFVAQPGDIVPCGELVATFYESEAELAEISAAAPIVGATLANTAATEDALATASAAAVPASAAPAPAVTASSAGGRIIASPLAKKIAADNALDLRTLAGSGPQGRIVKRDVLAALERGVPAAAPFASGAARELARIPMAGMRKTIAGRMTQSLQSTAQLSSGWESDITDLLAARKKFVSREQQLGTRVSVNAFIVKAMVYAIRRVPIANSCQEGDDIVIYDNINMGVAVSLPGVSEYDSGLVVAVLRNVERMGLVDIDREMKALVERVRNGQGTADDLSGATITLSSTAGIAPPGLMSTPVLNLPNAALVGPSTAVEKAVVRDGELVVRTMMPVSFTFDHRMLDGEPAARFMNALHEALENPELMLA